MADDKKGFFGKLFGGKKEEAATPPPSERPQAEEKPVAAPEPLRGAATPQPEAPIQDAAAVPPVPTPEPQDETKPKEVQEEPKKKGFFTRLTEGLSKTSQRLTDGVTEIFTKRKLDDETIEEFEDLLISADLGLPATERVVERLRKRKVGQEITDQEVREVLAEEVASTLEPLEKPLAIDKAKGPHVILVVGVNGAGKTTTIGKLAAKFSAEGHSVMLAAGDTFRAAAIEQLAVWGERTGSPVLTKPHGADAAGLAYEAIETARANGHDVLLIDTAGRLQNRSELMDELGKIVRVIKKLDPEAPHDTLLVLDATVGQNALRQAEAFTEVGGVTGLVMTKLDGTARGGVLVAVGDQFGLPIHYIGIGESLEDLRPFVARDFASALTSDA